MDATWLLLLISFLFCAFAKKPNVVIILTDDQDQLLGGIAPMKKTQQLIASQGVTFENSFVSTPVCCPSRASILTGLYQHNHGTLNNSLPGNCNGLRWQNVNEKQTFSTFLHSNGYKTFYAGKYLNEYGSNKAGGAKHVPPGWDWWIGLIGNSKYYNYSLSINGTKSFFSDKYLTNVIQKYSTDFLKAQHVWDDPFLMVLATPSPHEPFTPEDQYKGNFSGIKVPRTPNFNYYSGKTKHWLTRMPPHNLSEELIHKLDEIQGMRWETLLSVDDLVESVVNELEANSLLNDTYIIFTSDNGFHLGHFTFAWDKRQMYETDIRVPLVMRGPNIPAKEIRRSAVVNIDISSTVLDIAGIPYGIDMFDGISFLGLATGEVADNRTRNIVIEYHGESNEKSIDPACPWLKNNNLDHCSHDADCKCQDALNNTYNCLRRLNFEEEENFVLCDFDDQEQFSEFYDLGIDPFQLRNGVKYLDNEKRNSIRLTMSRLSSCRGATCQV